MQPSVWSVQYAIDGVRERKGVDAAEADSVRSAGACVGVASGHSAGDLSVSTPLQCWGDFVLRLRVDSGLELQVAANVDTSNKTKLAKSFIAFLIS
ncbi:unnamed protein product [Phytophthora lilii]|uniref:Unnamed protein product n=1 Tax=Phytophthora lilii TaxID=2077276 RepID=A0A9W6WVW9_9STRA|nr:unnamed protein product [Phytophthora lilii]